MPLSGSAEGTRKPGDQAGNVGDQEQDDNQRDKEGQDCLVHFLNGDIGRLCADEETGSHRRGAEADHEVQDQHDAQMQRVDEFYTDDVMYDYRGTQYGLEDLKPAMKDMIESEQRVRINNILISEDWAAIHFWNVVTSEDGSKDAWNHMQFLHFVETEDGLKVDLCWAK